MPPPSWPKSKTNCTLTIADHFDLIAGTSTGGLIALAMGAGISPAQIVDFYVTHGPTIFGRPPYQPPMAPQTRPRRAARRTDRGVRGPPPQLQRRKARHPRLQPRPERRLHLQNPPPRPPDQSRPALVASLATTAAPTFLPASPLGHRRLVDGGVWANNPTLVAVAEARSMLGIALDDMAGLSVGTTDKVMDLPSSLDHGGLYRWAARRTADVPTSPGNGKLPHRRAPRRPDPSRKSRHARRSRHLPPRPSRRLPDPRPRRGASRARMPANQTIHRSHRGAIRPIHRSVDPTQASQRCRRRRRAGSRDFKGPRRPPSDHIVFQGQELLRQTHV